MHEPNNVCMCASSFASFVSGYHLGYNKPTEIYGSPCDAHATTVRMSAFGHAVAEGWVWGCRSTVWGGGGHNSYTLQ